MSERIIKIEDLHRQQPILRRLAYFMTHLLFKAIASYPVPTEMYSAGMERFETPLRRQTHETGSSSKTDSSSPLRDPAA